ncbi:DNA-binding transcriptional regulator, AcrR family [Microlunatus sagamiharensis]|uniref:DNA-binding transcriptional regulator, AcrR family n=1 Tax=Microlunatus sagamiharensis TaxID=546874 RepID=A0A1H2MR96_9ACTN|nr:TetR/AcrR family transcriptional regulator [Microlunatus sagamiharensis]SDU95777.1 DNA-binding transcriptional regulator, AcrR family [Microlunatus sagamiharensis]
MADRPFHHGNLRQVLLERAEAMLRVDGVDALSLRDLARQAGVSHGAPRSHFIDRQALLDALAVRGFDRLTSAIRSALRSEADFDERFRRVARTYVAFAVDDAALMELMFAVKHDGSGLVRDAAAGLFQVLDEALEAEQDGPPAPADVQERFKLLFAATLQGTATLVAARRITADQADRLVDDAVGELLGSALGAQVLGRSGAGPGTRVRGA